MDDSSILSPTQKYAAAALFTLALNRTQVHQTGNRNDAINRNKETIREGGAKIAVSDNPDLWIHDKFSLLWPVFRSLGVDDKALQGLKQTASSSSQFWHHLGAFLTLLSEEGDGASLDRLDKELALTKAIDATAVSMEGVPDSKEVEFKNLEDKARGQDNFCNTKASSSVVATAKPHETKENSALHVSTETAPSTGPENDAFDQPIKEANLISYQRKMTVLYTLLSACVADTAEVDEQCSHSRQGYDARHRVALRLLSTWLGVKWIEMEAMEKTVVFSIMDLAREKNANEEEPLALESNWDKWKRGGIIGAAAVTGGTLMAITGGLAAPAIAHGLGALAPSLGTLIPAVGGGIATAATATGSVAGSVAVAASFGAAGAGLTGSKMAVRIGSLEEFELKEVGGNFQGCLAVGIYISGLAFEEEDFLKPWEGQNGDLERYVLQWESNNLIALSTAIKDWLTSQMVKELITKGAMTTVLSSLVTALAWPATLISTFDLIDNKWAIAADRSDKAGKVLAEVLLKGLQGNRPVTLVGFSLGARVIFKCLQYLAESEGDNAGLVERAVILGAPISIKDENWESARKMVAGRFVNVYSTNDWTLAIAFRASLLSQGLAGIQPVDHLPGVENVDVTQLIEGHNSYLCMTKQILEQLELDNYYAVFGSGYKITQEECVTKPS
ncbi:transmembrane and coiled-coil domain-containing protein 4 [Neltuma alba]|uniref:transmembrane and coiled-coil domain-containing protein 4 n=1 Tax=Neltuma alba TaxID=207710 RepID=UPI0010A3C8BD|nr:transmembrane and coiled-coil domain-containing protein 4-like [Prosopis alba]XP_028765576.1 transmembrane and coiled-coil domain-containing protein 4-like [Prosopis alba]